MNIIFASGNRNLMLSLQILLEEQPDLAVVGTASELLGLNALAQALQPDLVILDWDLCGGSGNAFLEGSQAQMPRTAFIVMATDFRLKAEVLDLGAEAFIVKGDRPASLLGAIHALRFESRRVVEPGIAATADEGKK